MKCQYEKSRDSIMGYISYGGADSADWSSWMVIDMPVLTAAHPSPATLPPPGPFPTENHSSSNDDDGGLSFGVSAGPLSVSGTQSDWGDAWDSFTDSIDSSYNSDANMNSNDWNLF